MSLTSLDGKRVWVAGHGGLVGSAIVRALEARDIEVITVPRSELDLVDQSAVARWMKDVRPEAIFLAAAKVGGIMANATRPAEFLFDNLVIETNVIDAAWRNGVEKLLFLGSTCVYPKFAPQPIREESLLTGPLEPTNEAYAIAKIAGLKLCEAYSKQYGADFISAMPTNLYGPNDNFELEGAHVVPALIRRMHEAKASRQPSVTIWGSGTPRREFLHADDAADALVFLMENYSGIEPINVGTGDDVTIADLAGTIGAAVGYDGALEFDRSRPDGTPRKLTDVAKLSGLGWRARIGLEDGVRATYRWYLENRAG